MECFDFLLGNWAVEVIAGGPPEEESGEIEWEFLTTREVIVYVDGVVNHVTDWLLLENYGELLVNLDYMGVAYPHRFVLYKVVVINDNLLYLFGSHGVDKAWTTALLFRRFG